MITICEFISGKELMQLNLASKKFYDEIVPLSMTRLRLYPSIPRYLMVYDGLEFI